MLTPLEVYSGLFIVAFLAASIFPAQSELLLSALIYSNEYQLWALLLAASTGNILGSVLNWFIGYKLQKLKKYSWCPVKEEKLKRGRIWYNKYGRWSLLFSWLPIVGDPITIMAGILKEPLSTFVLLVSVAKTSRYLVIATLIAN